MFILRAGEVYLQSQFVFPGCNEEEKNKKIKKKGGKKKAGGGCQETVKGTVHPKTENLSHYLHTKHFWGLGLRHKS